MIRRYSQYKSRGLTIDLPHVYPLGRVFKGQLFAMPMPSCDQLEQLMSALRADGIDSVVSLLEHAESKKLGLAEEQSACHADSAMNLVKLKRGRCVPETEAQTNIIRQFGATHPKNAPR